jgi:hypothetical protein
MFGFDQITDLRSQADRVRQSAHGVIEVVQGRLVRVRLRPYPKLASLPEVLVWGRLLHAYRRGDRCLLYYNQPRRCPGFLTLKYLVSNAGTSFATFRRAVAVLDQIAELKRSDAIVAEVANVRISERLLARWGWQRHLAGSRRRHYIKRFYGCYTAAPTAAAAGVLSNAPIP